MKVSSAAPWVIVDACAEACIMTGHLQRGEGEGGLGGAGGEKGRIRSIWSHLSLCLGGLLLKTMELIAMSKGKIRVRSHNAYT